MDLEAAVDTSFRFLSLPAEIRLNIYRYVLLEKRLVTLDPLCRYWLSKEENGSIRVNQYDDDHHLHIDTNLERGPWMRNHLNLDHLPAALEPQILNQLTGALKHVKCHTAILQINHQIYHEASALLYSSLVMEVEPGDVIFSDTWAGIVEPCRNIWRSLPRRPGVKNLPVEKVGYKRHNHLHGTMQPTSFAKFERIAFIFDLALTANDEYFIFEWPRLVVDGHSYVSRDNERFLKACLNGDGTTHPPVRDIFRQFVDVLMKSSYISHLAIFFGVHPVIEFDIDSEGSEDERDEDSRRRQEEKEDEILRAADERASELAMEVGVLDPLKRLSNVRRLTLSFTWANPKPKVLQMTRELKEVVEGNFVAKQGVT